MLTDLMRRYSSLEAELIELKSSIVDMVKKGGNADGIRPIESSSLAYTVRLQDLIGGNLAATTYIGTAQADAVSRRLGSARTPLDVYKAVQDMVESRKIRFAGNDSVTLNPNTVRILQSYLSVSHYTQQ